MRISPRYVFSSTNPIGAEKTIQSCGTFPLPKSMWEFMTDIYVIYNYVLHFPGDRHKLYYYCLRFSTRVQFKCVPKHTNAQ